MSQTQISPTYYWSPAQIPGCALWLDGADPNSLLVGDLVIATFSSYVTTTPQTVSYTGTITGLDAILGGTSTMNGAYIGFDTAAKLTPSATPGIWYSFFF